MHLRSGFTALLLLSALAGCTTGAGEPDYSPGSAAVLKPGESLVLPGDARLRYVEVAADSRCPPGVQCIRAGDATVRFELEAGGAPEPLLLTIPGNPARTLAGWRIELLGLDFGAPPAATVRVQAAER